MHYVCINCLQSTVSDFGMDVWILDCLFTYPSARRSVMTQPIIATSMATEKLWLCLTHLFIS